MMQSKWLSTLMTSIVFYGFFMIISVVYDAGNVYAAEQKTQNSKKVPAMRNRVYTQLARAQQLADSGDKIEGFNVLDEVKERIEQLNSYERAMMWNFYGFMYYANDDVDNAVDSFKQVIAQEAIPESLYQSTVYSLAQLSMQQQDYEQALTFLKDWQSNHTKPLQPSQHIVFAQVYYQDKQFEQSIKHIVQAISLAKIEDQKPKENWLILQRAAYYELKQPEKVTQVMEVLVKLYQKPQYWLQLAGMYGEVGQEKKQLGTMETAWQAGYITKSSDIIILAQLYLFNQLPYKAAKLLDDAISKGVVVANERRFQLMAQAYVMAKEDEKAIPVLLKGSEIADNGKFDEQLAQAYLNTENWQQAIDFAKKAIKRGNLDNEGNMYLAQGMGYFNQQQFKQSISSFEQAMKFSGVSKTAKQWIAYVLKEQRYQQQLAMVNPS